MKWDIPSLEELEDAVWKCTACGNCKVAYDFGPPPTYGEICPAGVEYGFDGNMSSKGKIAFARGVLDGTLPWTQEFVNDIYRCTICGGCQNQCELDHKPVIPEIIEALRRKAVADGVGPMPTQKVIAQSLRSYDNPYQGPRRVRTDWARPFKKAKNPIKNIMKENAPVLFYVGCTGAFNLPVRNFPVATASIFQKLGVDFGILGENEICCGSTAMRLGDVEEFKRVAETNMKTFKDLKENHGVETIVTSCAGCFRAMKKDYSLADEYEDHMGGIKVIHTTQFLFNYFQEGKIKFTREVPWKVTYHDPCHTGRHLIEFEVDEDGSKQWKGSYLGKKEDTCLYDIPREILKAIPGLEFVEMERIRSNSYCCGGGGGVMTGYGEWAKKNAGLRVQEALETGAEKMVSICPFCHYNLNEGSKLIQSDMKVYDLVELIDMAL